MQHYPWNNIGLGMSELVLLLILEVVCVLVTPNSSPIKLIIGLMLMMGDFSILVSSHSIPHGVISESFQSPPHHFIFEKG